MGAAIRYCYYIFIYLSFCFIFENGRNTAQNIFNVEELANSSAESRSSNVNETRDSLSSSEQPPLMQVGLAPPSFDTSDGLAPPSFDTSDGLAPPSFDTSDGLAPPRSGTDKFGSDIISVTASSSINTQVSKRLTTPIPITQYDDECIDYGYVSVLKDRQQFLQLTSKDDRRSEHYVCLQTLLDKQNDDLLPIHRKIVRVIRPELNKLKESVRVNLSEDGPPTADDVFVANSNFTAVLQEYCMKELPKYKKMLKDIQCHCLHIKSPKEWEKFGIIQAGLMLQYMEEAQSNWTYVPIYDIRLSSSEYSNFSEVFDGFDIHLCNLINNDTKSNCSSIVQKTALKCEKEYNTLLQGIDARKSQRDIEYTRAEVCRALNIYDSCIYNTLFDRYVQTMCPVTTYQRIQNQTNVQKRYRIAQCQDRTIAESTTIAVTHGRLMIQGGIKSSSSLIYLHHLTRKTVFEIWMTFVLTNMIP